MHDKTQIKVAFETLCFFKKLDDVKNKDFAS
jgi:hypothetical protein